MRRHTGTGVYSGRRAALAAALVAALVAGGLGAVGTAAAQVAAGEIVPGDSLLSIRLADGSTLVARIQSVQGDRIVLVTDSGARVEVERASIVSIRPASSPFDDPNTSRLFFGPTGRTIAAGEGYVGLFELFLPFLSIGATDWLTLSGGTPIVPELMGEVFYLAPKVRVVNLPRFQASTGVLAFIDAGADGGSLGILYGVGSLGDRDNSGTFGVGFPFEASGDQSDFADPVFMLGGESRTGRITKVLTENYVLLHEEAVLATVGMRIFGERFSGDLGIGAAFGGNDGVWGPLPLINVVYTFGGGQ